MLQEFEIKTSFHSFSAYLLFSTLADGGRNRRRRGHTHFDPSLNRGLVISKFNVFVLAEGDTARHFENLRHIWKNKTKE